MSSLQMTDRFFWCGPCSSASTALSTRRPSASKRRRADKLASGGLTPRLSRILCVASIAESAAPLAPQTDRQWRSDVLLVDGSNLVPFSAAASATLHTFVQGAVQAGNVASFRLWLRALRSVTSATQVMLFLKHLRSLHPSHACTLRVHCELADMQVYVVFEPARSASQPQPASVTSEGSDRRSALSTYKTQRAAKKARKAVASGARPRSATSTGAQADRYAPYTRAAEQVGCCVLRAPTGREADDVLFAAAQWLVGTLLPQAAKAWSFHMQGVMRLAKHTRAC